MPPRFLTAALALLFIAPLMFALPVTAQTSPESDAAPETSPEAPTEPPMTMSRIGEIVTAIDPDRLNQGNMFQLTLQDVPVLVIVDPVADRMRAMVPIRAADGLSPDELMRVMQANFDSALDARYAVARGRLWSVFIHPLSPLEKDQFLSGLVQTVNVARTYGTLYSGGASVFGGGDTNDLYQELLDDLRELGDEI